MQKPAKQIAGFISAIVFLLSMSGCSIFKEDDCDCPSFGKHNKINKEAQTIQANK